ncbi:MAG: transporter [Mycobacterium sp.]|nr:transporter [Mycobacterium sp.]
MPFRRNIQRRTDSLPVSRPVSSPTIVLIIILTCQLMLILDASIVITALPKMKESLHFSTANLSWVTNAYTLAFGGLLLLGARMGDILGRRQVFVVGIGLFTVASLVGGLAPSEEWLLIARAVQGIAAAIAAPSTLALLMMTFRDGRERARAIGLYSSISGAGSSIGLVLGGFLTDALSWRWGFFINVPIGIAMVILAPRYLPETQRNPGRFDFAGALTSTLGMTALVYGFVRASSDGWSNQGTIASFVAGVLLLAAFGLTETRAQQPITPLRLFADRQRTGSFIARMFLVCGMFSSFFFMTQYLQGVRDYSALKAGFAFLPLSLVMFGMVRVVPRFAARFSHATLIAAGALLAFGGMAWMSRLDTGTSYFPQIAIPMVMLGAGIGIAFIPLTTVSIAGVAPEDSGAASGLVNVSQQIGGTLGIAVLVTFFGAATRHATAHPLAGLSATDQARHVLANGVSAALTGSAAFLLLSLTIVGLLVRQRSVAKEPVVELSPQPYVELEDDIESGVRLSA